MPLHMTMDVLGEERLQMTFAGWKHRAEYTRPAFQAMSRDFRKIMVRQFDTEGAFLNGVPWLGLADSTLRRKESESLDMRTLHATRRMRKSLTMGRVGYRQITSERFRIGSIIPYTNIHQRGSSKMPQRIIFQFTPWVSRRWRDFVGQYLFNGTITFRSLG